MSEWADGSGKQSPARFFTARVSLSGTGATRRRTGRPCSPLAKVSRTPPLVSLSSLTGADRRMVARAGEARPAELGCRPQGRGRAQRYQHRFSRRSRRRPDLRLGPSVLIPPTQAGTRKFCQSLPRGGGDKDSQDHAGQGSFVVLQRRAGLLGRRTGHLRRRGWKEQPCER